MLISGNAFLRNVNLFSSFVATASSHVLSSSLSPARRTADCRLESLRCVLPREVSDHMEQSRREAGSGSAIHETPNILWNRKLHCTVRKSVPLVLILGQLNPVHNLHPISLIIISAGVFGPNVLLTTLP
jgi:hypothetical protein